MEQIEIGLWVTAGMLVLVVAGMRVAFAAALAGVVGLVLIFWAKKDFDPEKFGWALTVAVKQAGHTLIARSTGKHHFSAETAQLISVCQFGRRKY